MGIIAKKTERTQIHFLSDVLVAVASLDLKVPNSRRVRTHEKDSGVAVRRLGTIIQSLNVWKWSGESRYSGAFPLVLENFRRAFSPGPTNHPWVAINYSIARGRNLSTVEFVVTIFILIAL